MTLGRRHIEASRIAVAIMTIVIAVMVWLLVFTFSALISGMPAMTLLPIFAVLSAAALVAYGALVGLTMLVVYTLIWAWRGCRAAWTLLTRP